MWGCRRWELWSPWQLRGPQAVFKGFQGRPGWDFVSGPLFSSV